jgi:hypothetical protein
MKHPLVKGLRDLQAYCELILYTCLPKSLCENFFQKIPELKTIFSYIFYAEDMVENDEYLIKDISVLMDINVPEIV